MAIIEECLSLGRPDLEEALTEVRNRSDQTDAAIVYCCEEIDSRIRRCELPVVSPHCAACADVETEAHAATAERTVPRPDLETI